MSELLTVTMPDELARRARALAAACNRPLEEAVVDWISRAVAEPPIASLTDEQVLLLCDATLDKRQQGELSDLLAGNGEGNLTDADRTRLDQLMIVYRQGLVRKAQALKEAVSRGLKPSLADDAA